MARPSAPTPPGFDRLVLTVANEVQRRFAERMLAMRDALGALPEGLRATVVADPAGRRVGSGGSTLLCLAHLAREGAPRGTRTLVLHSGGDSRRLPAWSAMGKIWVPLGRRGIGIGPAGVPALFDLVLAELSRLAMPASGGVLVASGDAALRLAGERVALDARHATVLSFPGDPARAARHGVFVLDRDGRVLRTLQKPSRDALRAAGAMDARGRAQVDSGIFHFPPEACAALLRGARGMLPALARGTASLDLYQEVAEAMAAGATEAAYLARFAPDRRDPRRRTLAAFFRAAHRVRLRAAPLSAGRFLHLGSTRELVDRLASSEPERLFPDLLHRRDAGTAAAGPAIGHGRAAGLPEGIARAVVRLPRGRCAVALHGIDDDCKSDAASGGTACGRPLAGLPTRTGLDARAIWGDGPRTLWFARVHPVARDPRDAEAAARWLAGGGKATAAWHALPRASFAQLMSMADPAAAADAAATATGRAAARGERPLDRARALAAASALAPSPRTRAACRDAALEAVGEAVGAQVALPAPARRLALAPGAAAVATAPVRVDLAGGWSDTPPLCIEHGGAVVNMALLLDGIRPVRAAVCATARPAIVLRSLDAGRTARYASARQLLDHADPSRWDALPRAALVLSGIAPRDPRADLRAHLARLGGGLDITLSSDVPRGSGLGTSSILGAALLAALDRAAGRAHDPCRIARHASLLEQMIGSRGGWQDQAGGLWGGIKLCTTRAGARQVPAVTPLRAPTAFVRALERRGVLLFSGRRRMARGILGTVVLRYLRGERAVLDARARLAAGAHLLADAVRAGDLDEFALRVNDYRDLKATVDPASLTPELTGPVEALGRDVAAWTFCGAGGGGFVFLLARSPAAAGRIRDRLRRRPPHRGATVHDLRIDPRGLDVALA